MEVRIYLEAEQAQKWRYIQQNGLQDPSELIEQAVGAAIDTYYCILQDSAKTALERFQAFDLVGCMNGMPDLPSTDHSSIQEYLNQKRQQGRL
ncbi:hypothetical protein [Myxacorys almedinensis]|uniref:Uncharacterized protein n=1 Tax=Myxacorys almedinensis A TaxID=2690445 RepID=A0A8J8CLK5_9CYAN|nr:hypothetical protein [Myxacorys almedinensis]NDJ19761.1 hypothetical protein [Myxacorys almedinensis A]